MVVWNFETDFSKPRKGPAQTSFSGDWRGGSALHQKPQPGNKKPKQAQSSAVVENESDEELAVTDAKADDSAKPDVKLIWDASKGMLVPAAADSSETKEEPTKAAVAEEAPGETGGEEAAADDDEESGEEEEGEEEPDVEAESRAAFLTEASTPELIKQAVSIGGAMADATKDKWVLDQATQLYFKWDSETQKMYCWNTGQGCMYHWKERGKMTYLWAAPSGAGSAPPTGRPDVPVSAAQVSSEANPAATPAASSAALAQDAAPAAAPQGEREALWLTMIPPQVLVAGGVEELDAQVEEEIELNSKAMAAVIGKGQKGIKEIEASSGVKASSMDAQENDASHIRRLKLEGTRAQIATARSAIEQRVVVVLGHKAAEKMQKHWSSQLLEKKRAETGSEAAKSGVRGLSEFALEHGLKAVMARKLSKLDAMLQRYMIRHFKPTKAKAANALRGYLAALFRHPQRWRLEALYEDGELDGEICETIPIREEGAVLGREQGPEAMEEEGQFIELEVNFALGPQQASKIYGDVQAQHCRVHRMGNDFYVMALESQIGTIVDGQKFRETDGPVPIRDGTVLGVGKYLFYCEVGSPLSLQERRKRLLEGERFWREGNDSLQLAEREAAAAAQAAEDEKAVAEARQAAAGEDAEVANPAEDEDEDEEENLESLFKQAGTATVVENEGETDAIESRKRKREEEGDAAEAGKAEEDQDTDAPLPDPVALEEVDELPDVSSHASE